MQVRYPYWQWAFPDSGTSSAYNLDVALAARRSCFEGNETWLNTVERGQDYTAGDIWGCIGNWYSGRWYTQPSKDYITGVQDLLKQRVWETSDFIRFTP
jgi:autotransporter family porin